MIYFFIILIIVCLFIYALSRNQKRRQEKERESKQVSLERFKETADKLSFQFSDIVAKTRTYEKMSEVDQSLIDGLLEDLIPMMAELKHKKSPVLITYIEVDLMFEYNKEKIKARKSYPMDLYFFKIHLSKYPLVDIYIRQESLLEEDDQIDWTEARNTYYHGKNLYQYYIDWPPIQGS